MSKTNDRRITWSSLDFLRSRIRARAPHAAVFALALAILGQAGIIAMHVARLRAAGGRNVEPAGARAPSVHPPAFDVEAIVRAHLFGAAPARHAQADRATARQTGLRLVLSGTFAAADPGKGLAIMGPTLAVTKLYGVGQSVPGGGRLRAVYTASVLIERDGQIEPLLLSRDLGKRILPRASAPPLPPVPAPPAATAADATSDAPPPIVGGIIQTTFVSRRGARGFVLTPGGNVAAFTSLGLRPGDVVTAVDGKPVDSELGGGQILNSLNTASTARLTIVRHGKASEVNVNLGQVAALQNSGSDE